jgi:hypothetical protein
VRAAHDAEMAALVREMLKDEPTDGPFADLVGRLIALAS